MDVPENVVKVRLGEIRNTCFVILPFASKFQIQYETVIKPAVEELGFECKRADEIYSKSTIMTDIWKSIRTARFIIAELTGKNVNVFYEIGLSHAIGKPTIIITRDEDDVPSDLKALKFLYYDINDPHWGENLKKALQSLIEKIQEEEGLLSYLEDIAPLEGLSYPKEPEVKVPPSVPSPPQLVLTGVWKGTWIKFSGTIEHEGTLTLIQEGNMISAVMHVNFVKKGENTIVQEMLTGVISENNVILNAVSYSYLQKGSSSNYNLDNFELDLSRDKLKMEGDFYNSKGARGHAVFNKLKEENSSQQGESEQ